jgi:hypothetical protein
MKFKKTIIILILLLKSIISVGQYKTFLTSNKYKYIDSLNIHRQDKNSEIILLGLDKSLTEIKRNNGWERAYQRGIISKYTNDNYLKNGIEKDIYQFDVGLYNRVKILYCGNSNKTIVIIARFYNQNIDLSKKIDTMFLNYDIKNIENSIINKVSQSETIVSNFTFKPFSWIEKSRIEFRNELMNNTIIDSQKIKDVLNSYQIASGYNTAVGQILAMKEFILEGNKIIIVKWLSDKNITITNIEQLRGFIQNYDPLIDIVNNSEFKE